MKINLSSHGVNRKKSWVTELQRQFALDHDIKPGVQFYSYVATPGGAKAFAEWLKYQGFAARFWCIEPHTTYDSYGRKQVDYIGFGVEFDDKCPKLTEVRLKS